MNGITWRLYYADGATLNEADVPGGSARHTPPGATVLALVNAADVEVARLSLTADGHRWRQIWYRVFESGIGTEQAQVCLGFGRGRWLAHDAIEATVWGLYGGRITLCPARWLDQAAVKLALDADPLTPVLVAR